MGTPWTAFIVYICYWQLFYSSFFSMKIWLKSYHERYSVNNFVFVKFTVSVSPCLRNVDGRTLFYLPCCIRFTFARWAEGWGLERTSNRRTAAKRTTPSNPVLSSSDILYNTTAKPHYCVVAVLLPGDRLVNDLATVGRLTNLFTPAGVTASTSTHSEVWTPRVRGFHFIALTIMSITDTRQKLRAWLQW